MPLSCARHVEEVQPPHENAQRNPHCDRQQHLASAHDPAGLGDREPKQDGEKYAHALHSHDLTEEDGQEERERSQQDDRELQSTKQWDDLAAFRRTGGGCHVPRPTKGNAFDWETKA